MATVVTTFVPPSPAAAQTAPCPCTIFDASSVPLVPIDPESAAVEVGVRFRPAADGVITALRFYKGGPTNGGTHVGHLWSEAGAELAAVTFTDESAAGWQQADLATPVPVTAGATYIASYFAPQGHYAADVDTFDTEIVNGPLTALASVAAAGNGVYRYGGGFPTGTWANANYWVDVVFQPAPDTVAPTVTARVPAAGATGVAVSSVVSATLSEPVTGAQVSVTGAGGAAVAGSVAYDAGTRTVTFTPAASLAAGTVHAVAVSGARDAAGNVMAPVSWSFTTAAAPPADPAGCPCTIWPATAEPSTVTSADGDAVELGVKFRAAVDGVITGVRFYKGSTANTGPHIGRIWSSAGVELAVATFHDETASGWQEVSFSEPLPVTAGTTYVASYFAPAGRYAVDNGGLSSAVTRGPLSALADGTEGGNGVYRYGSGGVLPTSTYNASNYWVDVVFAASAADTTAPTVVERVPAPNAAAVDPAGTVRATFSEPIEDATFTLIGPSGAVSSATSYDAGTRALTLTPNSVLAGGTSYQVDLSGARDAAGNVMAPLTWSFSTAAASTCPCTIFDPTSTPATVSSSDGSAVELGVKFRADRAGFITGIRFYKGAGNGGLHVGSLWTSSGTRIASGPFTSESASGWQQMTFAAPVPIEAGTTYVASYHAPAGRYSFTPNALTNAVTRGPLTALSSTSSGGNGVYAYGGGGFPTSSFNATSYFVDVVFTSDASDTVAPTITNRVPAPDEAGVALSSPIAVTFSEPIAPGSISIEVAAGSTPVAGETAYDANTLTATFTPSGPLAASTAHQVTVSGARDAAGNTIAPSGWSFTTAAPPPPPPVDGPGGPIGVVTSGSDRFSTYFAEVLRAEGLNEFATFDVGDLTASTLAEYDTVILGRVTLTTTQVSALTTWVNAGGNLIASRPDAKLASLLGLSPAGGTLSNAYLRVSTASEPGAGIVGETMQFHGTADRYTLAGATAVATLYSNASTATSNPAVTLRSVGSSGGQAAAFTYDLARSIVYTRQGNPAWAGQVRDGQDGIIRSDNLFFGGSEPDWVDLSKVAIPQADEQQRLLANIIELVNRDVMPLPRFWYFPDEHRAVVIATGDDHANNGTTGRFDTYRASGPAGCLTANWECPRFTSYVFPNTPISNSNANAYEGQGFEIALHPNNGCNNFTPASLQATYAADLSAFAQNFPSLDDPATNRMHCLVWSDWVTQAEVELANGIRLDANYYYWPGSWVNDRPGFMTGSGMLQRFARTDGTMIDVYQAATQMTDESGQSYPFTPNTLLDRALGSTGYYGFFVANMHTDQPSTQQDTALVSSARARGVPIITARDALEWTDGRNGSSFGGLSWSGSALTFTVAVGGGATNLTGMVPTVGPGGRVLSTLTRGTLTVPVNRQTIKGIEYAMFDALPGAYTASYAAAAAPSIAPTAVVVDGGNEATISWSTEAPASSEVVFGTTADELDEVVVESGTSGEHEVTIEDLLPGETYYYRVVAEAPDGDVAVWPAEDDAPAEFEVPAADRRAPAITDLTVLPNADGTAIVTWRTDEAADTVVRFGSAPDALDGVGIGDESTVHHSVVLTGLAPDSTYFLRATSTDQSGNESSSNGTTAEFVSPAAGVSEYMAASLQVGRVDGTATLVEDDAGLGTVTLGEGSAGAFVSRVLDATQQVTWDRATWQADVPAGSALAVSVRGGDARVPDGSWTPWQPLDEPGARVELASRYVQYRVELRANDAGERPALRAVSITHSAPAPTPLGEVPYDD
jgi:hypothetical protein